MKFFSTIAITIASFVMMLQFVPVTVHAESIILIDCKYGKAIQNPYTGATEYECNFKDAMAQLQKLINFVFLAALPIMVIALTWSGINILLARGNMSKVTEARKLATKIMTGFIFVLIGWLLVYTLVSYFLKPEFYNVFLGGPK